jgi:Ala-tRNA(Pro) deacylase
MRLDEFLTGRGVAYERLHHRPAYSANRVAQALHVPGKQVAKAVLLRAGWGYALAVLPANRRVDLRRLAEDLWGEEVEVASEAEVGRVFPDCEAGAVPPFGSLYHLPTVVDESLAQDEQIVFEAQTHEEAIRMAYRDFEALEHPIKGHFASPA